MELLVNVLQLFFLTSGVAVGSGCWYKATHNLIGTVAADTKCTFLL